MILSKYYRLSNPFPNDFNSCVFQSRDYSKSMEAENASSALPFIIGPVNYIFCLTSHEVK